MTEVYLSRLKIDVRRPAAKHALSDLGEIHRLIMAAFPGDSGPEPRAAHGVLWRLEEGNLGTGPSLLVQSTTRPEWSRLPNIYPDLEPPEIREIGQLLARIEPAARLRFRLVANPTRKVGTKSGPDGSRRNGRRVPLNEEAELLEWLIRKARDAGIDVGSGPSEATTSVVIRRLGDRKGKHGAGGHAPGDRLTMRAVEFEGVLTVIEPDLFRAAMVAGVGTGKAFGHGLLTVARA